MRHQHTFRTATKALSRNIMRAALTTLGIVIGIAAVITMVEIGKGSSSSMKKIIENMGANTLLVMPGQPNVAGIRQGAGSSMNLTPGDCDAIARECPAITVAAPIVWAGAQIIYGNQNWQPQQMYGTTPEFLDVRNWSHLAEGECFTDSDVRNAAEVCLVGQTLVHELFQDQSPVGKEIRVGPVLFKVVGVLSKKGANMMGWDQDDILLAPWTSIKFRVTGANASHAPTVTTTITTTSTLDQIYPSSAGVETDALYPAPSASEAADTPLSVRFINLSQILVAAQSSDAIPQAISQITGLLRERHRVKTDDPDDFRIRDMTEITKALSSTTTLMGTLLLCVALISLVVGGVGIMNIMLVSVTERTREIGLRMAVGARPRDILWQFLTEAVLLCFSGGLVGIGMGLGSSYMVTKLLHWPTELSVAAIIAAVLVSVSVGVSFGFYPAWRASRLDPIDALRYE
jgi:ABC-type antimicrobial peptide transport system permease subunit